MSEKPLIFLSHITEEKELASIVRNLLEDTFPQVDIFQSSDEGISLPGGTNRINKITESLINSSVIVVLCSQESIYRPWINFESGAGWVRNIPVIPLCHSNLTREQLPMPLNLLTSANCNSPESINDILLKAIAFKIGSRLRSTNLDSFIKSVKTFEDSYTFLSAVDTSLRRLIEIITHAKEEGVKHGVRFGLPLCISDDAEEVRQIGKKLRALEVCSLSVRGTISGKGFEGKQIVIEEMNKFYLPEVQKWFR